MQVEAEFMFVWAARGGSTDEYGRGEGDISYHSRESTADAASKGQNWYGDHGRAVQRPVVVIDGKVYLLRSANPIDLDKKQEEADEQLRKKTLASMSDEQLRVLGLKRS